MKLLRRVYTLYGLILFSILFLLFFIPLLVPIVFRKQFRLVGILNRWWAKCLFTLMAIPFSVEYRDELIPTAQYIFCANHFSYLDIAAMGLNRHNTIFVGKNDMENIPLFGFMYRKLHITVDRSRLRSRYSTMLKTLAAIDEGKSLVIFPEGGIVSENPPEMASFKDGAFRASIEKQIPIVPVTIPFNWIILPVDEFLVRWRPLRIIFHEPIHPSAYKIEEIELFKSHIKGIIQTELQKQLVHEGRPHATR